MALFYIIQGNCCNVVYIKQEFRKKFLPKCVHLARTIFTTYLRKTTTYILSIYSLTFISYDSVVTENNIQRRFEPDENKN